MDSSENLEQVVSQGGDLQLYTGAERNYMNLILIRSCLKTETWTTPRKIRMGYLCLIPYLDPHFLLVSIVFTYLR